MKNFPKSNPIILAILFIGISSVVTQLVSIREFLGSFNSNEFAIALILFVWLIMGGIGSLIARWSAWLFGRNQKNLLFGVGFLSFVLCVMPSAQVMAIRVCYDIWFIHGTSADFYNMLIYIILMISPYSLMIGFALPYMLFVLREIWPGYLGSKVYIFDNIGDTLGGVLFSFVLIETCSPFVSLLIACIPLFVIASYLLYAHSSFSKRVLLLPLWIIGLCLPVLCILFESDSLTKPEGDLIHYSESRYGRVRIYQSQDQITLYEGSTPLFDSQNTIMAEEAVHYPLVQLDKVRHVLMISAQGGMLQEVEKYNPESVDYVELDPEIIKTEFQYGLLKPIKGLNVINSDGRLFLSDTKNRYNAILITLPEPDTFQINRFYTDAFFEIAKAHLLPEGVLCFSLEGFANYISDIQREKYSSLYNTAKRYFSNVCMIPGQKTYFICSDKTIDVNIPKLLESKKLSTKYISSFFEGDVSLWRIERLSSEIDESVRINRDYSPFLVRVMLSQWFVRFNTTPTQFIILVSVLGLIYLIRIRREEFVLFSSGFVVMGSEILVIFVFQVCFGYIYSRIGLIITVYLIGLLPGAIFGERLCKRKQGAWLLKVSDICMIVLMIIFGISVGCFAKSLPESFYLAFGFAISLCCGFQFPVALELCKKDRTTTTKIFAADLIGAAGGTLIVSIVLLPFLGFLWTCGVLIAFKISSMLLN